MPAPAPQEFYGHAGVEHRGKNFGIAPWIPGWLGIELRAEDHQLHHMQADVNFSKRFSLFDRLFSTWRDSATQPVFMPIPHERAEAFPVSERTAEAAPPYSAMIATGGR